MKYWGGILAVSFLFGNFLHSPRPTQVRVRESAAISRFISDKPVLERELFLNSVKTLGFRLEIESLFFLSELEKLLGLHFSESEISVYAINYGGTPGSDPIIIPMDDVKNFDDFLGKTSHEIVHHLMIRNIENVNTDNCYQSQVPNSELLQPSQILIAKRHIIVFSALKILFKDKPQILTAEINRNVVKGSYDAYARAWEVVQAKSPEVLINEFKENCRLN